MNFDFSEEQKLLQKTARDYLDGALHRWPTAARVLEGGGTHDAGALEGRRGDGLARRGGARGVRRRRLRRLELALIAQELGRALAPIPFGPSVYLVTEALLRRGQRGAEAALAAAARVGRADRRLRARRARGPRGPGAARDALRGRQALRREVPGAGRRRARACCVVVARRADAHRARAGRDRAVRRRGEPLGSLDPARARWRASRFDGARAPSCSARTAATRSCSRICSTAPPCSRPSSRSAAPSARSS